MQAWQLQLSNPFRASTAFASITTSAAQPILVGDPIDVRPGTDTLPVYAPTAMGWRYRGVWVLAWQQQGERDIVVAASPHWMDGEIDLIGWNGRFRLKDLWKTFPVPPDLIRDTIISYHAVHRAFRTLDSIPNCIHAINDEEAWRLAVESYRANES